MANSTMFYPHPTNSSNAGEFFFTYTHSVTGNIWGPLLLLTIFTISYMALSAYDIRETFAASSFTTTVAAFLFAPFEIISQPVLYVSVFMTMVSVVILTGDRR